MMRAVDSFSCSGKSDWHRVNQLTVSRQAATSSSKIVLSVLWPGLEDWAILRNTLTEKFAICIHRSRGLFSKGYS
jgi:hypothetical protein